MVYLCTFLEDYTLYSLQQPYIFLRIRESIVQNSLPYNNIGLIDFNTILFHNPKKYICKYNMYYKLLIIVNSVYY